MKFETYVHKIVIDHQPNFHKDPCKAACTRGVNARWKTSDEMRARLRLVNISFKFQKELPQLSPSSTYFLFLECLPDPSVSIIPLFWLLTGPHCNPFPFFFILLSLSNFFLFSNRKSSPILMSFPLLQSSLDSVSIIPGSSFLMVSLWISHRSLSFWIQDWVPPSPYPYCSHNLPSQGSSECPHQFKYHLGFPFTIVVYEVMLPNMRICVPLSIGFPMFPWPFVYAARGFTNINAWNRWIWNLQTTRILCSFIALGTNAFIQDIPACTIWYILPTLCTSCTIFTTTLGTTPNISKAEHVLYLSFWIPSF